MIDYGGISGTAAMAAYFARCLLYASVCLTLVLSPASGQEYPRQQPIKLVVPFPAGGGVDVVARIIAPKLSEGLGQSVVVENRPGAGGMLGATSVAQSQPDGYTILLGTGSTHGSNAAVYSRLGYDPVRDFVPIILIGSSPLVLVTNTKVPVTSVKELIAYARERPGQLNFGSFGIGSNAHLAAELFASQANIQANHIPYRGSPQALNDLIAGRIQYTFDGVQTSLGFIQAGTIKLLAVAGPERSALLPQAPTIAETIPGFDATIWSGLFAPAGTPKAVTDLLNSKANGMLGDPAVKELFAKVGIETRGGASTALSERVESELQKWVAIAREKGIRVEPQQ